MSKKIASKKPSSDSDSDSSESSQSSSDIKPRQVSKNQASGTTLNETRSIDTKPKIERKAEESGSDSEPESKYVSEVHKTDLVKFLKTHDKEHGKSYPCKYFTSDHLKIDLRDDFSLCILLTFENVDLSSDLHFGPTFDKYKSMYMMWNTDDEFQEATLMHSTGYKVNILDLTLCKLLKPEFMHKKIRKFTNLAHRHIEHLTQNGMFVIMFAACYSLDLEECTNEKRELVKDLRSLYNTFRYKSKPISVEHRYTDIQSIKWIDEDLDGEDLMDKIRKNSLIIFNVNIILDDCVEHLEAINGQWDPVEELIEAQDDLVATTELYKKYNSNVESTNSDLTQKIAQTLVSILENCTQTITKNFL